jgi:hypothetical protein
LHGPAGAESLYHAQVLDDDLRLHLRMIDRADAAWSSLFIDRVNVFLDRVDPGLFDGEWQMVRDRRLADLVDVVRSQNRPTLRKRLARRMPVRQRSTLRGLVGGLQMGWGWLSQGDSTRSGRARPSVPAPRSPEPVRR